MSFHICDATSPVCSCGRKWDFYRIHKNKDGTRTRLHCDRAMKDAYIRLYGEPKEIPFIPVEH